MKPSKRTLDLVWARDDSACVMCHRQLIRGQGGYSVHHRRPRGMGGSKDPVSNTPANMVLLCGSGTTGCHGVLESNRQWGIAVGLIVHQSFDPEEILVVLRPGDPVKLSADGRRGHVVDGAVVWEANPLLSRG